MQTGGQSGRDSEAGARAARPFRDQEGRGDQAGQGERPQERGPRRENLTVAAPGIAHPQGIMVAGRKGLRDVEGNAGRDRARARVHARVQDRDRDQHDRDHVQGLASGPGPRPGSGGPPRRREEGFGAGVGEQSPSGREPRDRIWRELRWPPPRIEGRASASTFRDATSSMGRAPRRDAEHGALAGCWPRSGIRHQ